MNKNPIMNRLQQLKEEKEAGEQQLRTLEQRSRDLQNTLLRISGAITVLEEVLREADQLP